MYVFLLQNIYLIMHRINKKNISSFFKFFFTELNNVNEWKSLWNHFVLQFNQQLWQEQQQFEMGCKSVKNQKDEKTKVMSQAKNSQKNVDC